MRWCPSPGCIDPSWQTFAVIFVRFQSAVPNRRGRFPGVFAVANGLALEDRLSSGDREAWRQANASMNAAYALPTATDPDCYDPDLYPCAAAWFKADGGLRLIGQTQFYLELLDRYSCPWVELRSLHPGHIHYEDEVQVVVTPYTFPSDWPFRGRGFSQP